MNIEAEGSELVLRNTNGDIAIVPKNQRKKALDLLNKEDHEGLDKLISSLPLMEDYADDGTVIPDGGPGKPIPYKKEISVKDVLLHPDKVVQEFKNRLKENLNPEDYAGLPTRVKEAIILNKKDPERERLESLPPLQEGEEPDRDRIRLDVMNLYSGKPQKFNTLTKSAYKPTLAKDKNAEYWDINDPQYKRGLADEADELKRRKTAIESNLDQLKLSDEDKEKLFEAAYVVDRRVPRDPKWFDKLAGLPGMKTAMSFGDFDKTIDPTTYKENEDYMKSMLPKLKGVSDIYKDKDPLTVTARELSRYNYKTKGLTPDTKSAIMQNHFVTFGKDDKGEYLSYNDVWDINPFPKLEKSGVDLNFGKPVPLYGRVYLNK